MGTLATIGRPATPSRPSPARARLLAAADRLFYGEGIRAVGWTG